MRTAMKAATLLLAVLAIVPASAAAQAGRGRDKPKQAGGDARGAASVVTEVEIGIIRSYYAEQRSQLKPLPPGIAKNLARGKPLPPGIAKTRLPVDLTRRLTARPDHSWLIEGDVVILVDPVGLVVDLVRLVF